MTSAGFGIAPRPTRSARVQIARGIGFTIALLVGLWITIYVGELLFFPHDLNTRPFRPYWPAVVPVAVVGVGSASAFIHMRDWTGRPRWLIPCSLLVVATTFAIALVPFSVTREFGSNVCVAIADAWHPVIPTPAPGDLAVWHGLHELSPGPVPPFIDPVRRRAWAQNEIRTYRARHDRIVATAAYQRADRYVWWTLGQGPCTSTSRKLLVASGTDLTLGTLGLGTLARRRRRSQTRAS